MIHKLERWVWHGGATLALIAGMVNAVGYLSLDRHAATHMTGTTTELSMAVAAGNPEQALHIAAILLAFTLGAVVSGFIIQDKSLQLGRRYGVALALESALLFGAAWQMRNYQADSAWHGIYLASLACGLQNAMASTYSGTVLRTTHLTGMFTDLGVSLGHWVRRLPVDLTRIKLCGLLITSFFLGGVSGAWLFARLGYATLYFPAGLTGGAAIAYTTYSHWKKPKERIKEHLLYSTEWIKRAGRKVRR